MMARLLLIFFSLHERTLYSPLMRFRSLTFFHSCTGMFGSHRKFRQQQEEELKHEIQ